MATIHYLRPQDRPGSGAAPREESPRLRIALSQVQLAAIITGETATRNAAVPAKAQALLQKFRDRSESSPRPDPGAAKRNPAITIGAKAPPISSSDLAAANIVSASVDAFAVDAVISGNLKFALSDEASADTGQSLFKLRSAFIAVPDDVLVARQNRMRQVAFSVYGMDQLAGMLNDLFRQNRHMIEGWAVNGGRPALNLRYQAKNPFGRIAHMGAESATDLRAVAVRISREAGARAFYYMIELSLALRSG